MVLLCELQLNLAPSRNLQTLICTLVENGNRGELQQHKPLICMPTIFWFVHVAWCWSRVIGHSQPTIQWLPLCELSFQVFQATAYIDLLHQSTELGRESPKPQFTLIHYSTTPSKCVNKSSSINGGLELLQKCWNKLYQLWFRDTSHVYTINQFTTRNTWKSRVLPVGK
jgi:hypothetical protein